MKRRLLDHLVCSRCEGELNLEVREELSDGEILRGGLQCRTCSHRYDIIRGIPRMVPDRLGKAEEETADAFGWQWQRFSELHDAYEEGLFLEWIQPISREFFRDKMVLDAGCGTGRHSYFSSRFGAREVFAVDLSAAVETAYRTVGHLPNVHVIQADILSMPFRRGRRAQLHFIYSIGVLHHTSNPRKSFLALVPLLKPGGTILAWVYGYENNAIVHYGINPVRALLTSRMPRRALYYLSFLLAVPLHVTVKTIYKPVNEQRWLRPLRKLLYYNSYLYHISKFNLRHNHTIIFDHLSAPTAFYIKREEFLDWFREAGLLQVQVTPRNENSWRGRGLRPPIEEPSVMEVAQP